MIEDVKILWSKMEKILAIPGNDMGDVAVWFVNSYLTRNSSSGLDPLPTEAIIDVTGSPAIEASQHQLPAKPVGRVVQNDRANLFAKRAGVDKLMHDPGRKMSDLVKDIQASSEDSALDNTYQDDLQSEDFTNSDVSSVNSLFTLPPDANQIDEIQKLQKLEQLQTTGSLGKIRRSS